MQFFAIIWTTNLSEGFNFVFGGPYTWTDVTCILLPAFTFRFPSLLSERNVKAWEKEGKQLRENPLRKAIDVSLIDRSCSPDLSLKEVLDVI